jgi:hypothetical protein
LNKVDLSQLLKGDSFTLLYTISSNKLRIKTYILINIKANKYIFINTKFVAITTIGTYTTFTPSIAFTSIPI